VVPARGTTPARNVALGDFKADNEKVWRFMNQMFYTTDNGTIIQPFLKKCDGRGAYLALKNYHLGPNNTNNMASKVESELSKLKYTGEKRRYNFDSYVKGHIRCHTVMKDLMKYGYSGIDDHTKVRRLLEGIHNRQLEACETRVMTDPVLKTDFNATVTLYKDFIASRGMSGAEDASAQIGAVGKAGQKKSYVNYDTTNVDVELKHYTTEEYKTLSNPQKLKLKKWREGKSENPPGSETKYNHDHPLMKKLDKISAAVGTNKKSDGASAKKKGTTAKAGKPTTNRNNKALVKQVSFKGGEDRDEEMDD
jgi:hypothetical protein